MDWTTLKTQATGWKDKTLAFTKDTLESGKKYVDKTGEFSYENIKKTIFTIKNERDFEQLSTEKKVVIVFLRGNDEASRKIGIQFIPLMVKAWIESRTIRICDLTDNPEFTLKCKITAMPSVITYKLGVEQERYEDEASIDAFLQSIGTASKPTAQNVSENDILAKTAIENADTPKETTGTKNTPQEIQKKSSEVGSASQMPETLDHTSIPPNKNTSPLADPLSETPIPTGPIV